MLAGPTCNSADVLYEKQPYALPVSLEIGDKLLIEGTGAYTATYSAVAFNGFAPLPTYPHLNCRAEGVMPHGHDPQERSTDIPARERLLDAAFGPARVAKTSERLREGRFAAEGLSFVAGENGRLVGTARLWDIAAGLGRPALLLGPVAVAETTAAAASVPCW